MPDPLECRAKMQLVDDDTITSECAHTNKGLFTTPALSLDLRYLTWTNDGCINPPNSRAVTS
jgi:hypothetical protein